MSSFLFTFFQVLPVFFLVGLGYVLQRVRFLNDEFLKKLSGFVFYILVPPLLFLSIAENDLARAFDPRVIFPTLLGLALFSSALYLLSGPRLSPPQRGVFTQGAFRSNLIFVGLAILVNLFGEPILGMSAVFIAFHALMNNLLSVLFLLLPHHSFKDRANWGRMGGQLLLNPVIIGCALGMAYSSTGWALPGVLKETLQGLCDAALPLALLIVGASLQRAPLKGQNSLVLLACFLKLVVLPGTMLLLLTWMGVHGRAVVMAVVFLGSPTAAISQIMAKEMKGDESLASAIVMATTLFSPFTLTAWISILS